MPNQSASIQYAIELIETASPMRHTVEQLDIFFFGNNGFEIAQALTEKAEHCIACSCVISCNHSCFYKVDLTELTAR